ncbi:MAG TPA: tetratricopeptide repeat protein [Longimicrobiales bacterium]|nr:tetratricopeptide repeat protein [Longimicrobiales bacterium]
MVFRLVPLVLLVFLIAPAAQPDPARPQSNQANRSQHVKNGVDHFNRAFYELTPRKRDVEATRAFDLAIVEFEAELRASPGSVDAHRYLGRIYTLRKQFTRAARHYDEMCALVPGDVDACVLAAVAYAEAGQRAEARDRLLAAKARTTDPEALAKLDQYLSKLDRHEPGDERGR